MHVNTGTHTQKIENKYTHLHSCKQTLADVSVDTYVVARKYADAHEGEKRAPETDSRRDRDNGSRKKEIERMRRADCGADGELSQRGVVGGEREVEKFI